MRIDGNLNIAPAPSAITREHIELDNDVRSIPGESRRTSSSVIPAIWPIPRAQAVSRRLRPLFQETRRQSDACKNHGHIVCREGSERRQEPETAPTYGSEAIERRRCRDRPQDNL